MNKVSASMLACDFADISGEIKKMESAGADMLHLDVMDGHFVPNISFGAPIIAKMRPKTELCFDVHLMISDPLFYIDDFIRAGSDIITFHIESECDPAEVIKKIKAGGAKAGISVKPDTPAEAVFPFLECLDMVLIMTVEPGFGGQSFMDGMLSKVALLRRYIDQNGLQTDVEVDGGINSKTGAAAAEAGANVLVAGSYIFGAADVFSAVNSLKV